MILLAIEHNALLLHDDRDFDVIAKIRPLANFRLSVGAPPRNP